jgi:hypothetical protein
MCPAKLTLLDGETIFLKSFENTKLRFRPANPFLDINLLISHSRLSMVSWNEIPQPFSI